MKIKSLYEIEPSEDFLNTKLAEQYSMYKFGDQEQIKKFGEEMVKLIALDIKGEDSKKIIITIPPYRVIPPAAYEIALYVSKKLHIKIMPLDLLQDSLGAKNYSQINSYKKRREYVRSSEFAPHQKKVISGYKIILIDDAVSTKATVTEVGNALLTKMNVEKVSPYSIIRLRKCLPSFEFDLNTIILKRKKKFVNLINKDGLHFTRFALRTIYQLPKEYKDFLYSNMTPLKKRFIENKTKKLVGLSIHKLK